MKQNKDIRLLFAIIASVLLFGSCSNDQVDDFFKKVVQAPASSIERDVKGHEQMVSGLMVMTLFGRIIHIMLSMVNYLFLSCRR